MQQPAPYQGRVPNNMQQHYEVCSQSFASSYSEIERCVHKGAFAQARWAEAMLWGAHEAQKHV